MTECRHCHARVDNGLLLCDLCQQKLRLILEYLPIYLRNLGRWRRPNRPNGSLGSGGSWMLRHGDTGDADRIGAAVDKAKRSILKWSLRLAKTRHIDMPEIDEHIDGLCGWLDEHLTDVAASDWCDGFLRDLDRQEASLSVLTETLIPGWYAGACRRCGTPTYVVAGLTWVTCKAMMRVEGEDGRQTLVDIGCGAVTYARDHVDVVLDEARDWVAPPRRIAEALVALLDSEQSVTRLHERLKKWQQRGRLHAIDRLGYWAELNYTGERSAPKRYRLGDVLDILLAEGATRTGARSAVATL